MPLHVCVLLRSLRSQLHDWDVCKCIIWYVTPVHYAADVAQVVAGVAFAIQVGNIAK